MNPHSSSASRGDPDYVLGHWPEEYERLRLQSTLFKFDTERFLRDAGIGSGMRVLDIGTGVGDVAISAGRMVGASGKVIGVDSDGGCLEVARSRAQAEGLSQVEFVVSDFRKFSSDGPFDAVAGRLVLLYQADPVAALGHLRGLLKPDGILALQDCVLRQDYCFSLPQCAVYHECLHVCTETFRRGGADLEMGLKLHSFFVAAGLPASQLRWNPIVVTRHAPGEFFEYLQQCMKTILPKAEELGVVRPGQVAVEKIGARLREEVERNDSILVYFPIVGAWSKKS